jgi:hypothetical protein
VARMLVSNGVLTTIFWRKLRTYPGCSRGVAIAIVPVGRSDWKAVTAPRIVSRYPKLAGYIEEAQNELRQVYGLKGR